MAGADHAALSAQRYTEGSTLSSSLPDIHDSELVKIQAVVEKLNEKAEHHGDREAFRREIIERFEEIGFGVDVFVYYEAEWTPCLRCVGVEGLECNDCEGRGMVMAAVQPRITADTPIYFKISLERRLEGEFDPDRQVHEVTSDLLGLGEGGVIESKKLIVPGGHSHSHGSDHHHR